MKGQLALFDTPARRKVTHDWMWRPGPSECASCLLLWFPGATRAEAVAFVTEQCPVKALDAAEQPPVIVYLVGA